MVKLSEGQPRKVVDIVDLQSRYEHEHPQAMSVLRLGGVYPREHQTIENPYTKEVHNEYFGNVGEHCLAVAGAAEGMANAIPVLNVPQRRSITERALIHDSTKRFEVMRRDFIRSKEGSETTSGAAYTATAYDSIRPILAQQGIAPDIIEYMVNAGKETGHTSMRDFVVLNDEGSPILNPNRTIAEKIVHLADDMTFTQFVKKGDAETSYLTVEERMAASDFPNRYPFLYKEGFGFDVEGKTVLVEDVATQRTDLSNIRTYADWQVWVGRSVAKDLVGQMDLPTSPGDAEHYLKELVNQ